MNKSQIKFLTSAIILKKKLMSKVRKRGGGKKWINNILMAYGFLPEAFVKYIT